MKDSTLLKTSLICSLVGLLLLSIVTRFAELNFPSENNQFLNEYTKVKGIVKNVRYAKDSIIIDITDIKDTKIFVYKPGNLNITKGIWVEIIGKADDDIIIADKLRIIK